MDTLKKVNLKKGFHLGLLQVISTRMSGLHTLGCDFFSMKMKLCPLAVTPMVSALNHDF